MFSSPQTTRMENMPPKSTLQLFVLVTVSPNGEPSLGAKTTPIKWPCPFLLFLGCTFVIASFFYVKLACHTGTIATNRISHRATTIITTVSSPPHRASAYAYVQRGHATRSARQPRTNNDYATATNYPGIATPSITSSPGTCI